MEVGFLDVPESRKHTKLLEKKGKGISSQVTGEAMIIIQLSFKLKTVK